MHRETATTNAIPHKALLDETEAARYIGMSVHFLRCDRSRGAVGGRTPGPAYLKLGRYVRYSQGKAVPSHLAFEAKSASEVQAFHAAALAAGARDNGKRGYRDYWPGYYAAFAHDPDGHNIEAVWYDYSKAPKTQ